MGGGSRIAKIYPGRHTARMEGPFVVFLIGVRINRLVAVKRWMSVTSAMGPMLRELYSQPELGFLHAESSLAWRGVTMIQYWRSFEHLRACPRQGSPARMGRLQPQHRVGWYGRHLA